MTAEPEKCLPDRRRPNGGTIAVDPESPPPLSSARLKRQHRLFDSVEADAELSPSRLLLMKRNAAGELIALQT